MYHVILFIKAFLNDTAAERENRSETEGVRDWRGVGMWLQKGNMRDPGGVAAALHLDCSDGYINL